MLLELIAQKDQLREVELLARREEFLALRKLALNVDQLLLGRGGIPRILAAFSIVRNILYLTVVVSSGK